MKFLPDTIARKVAEQGLLAQKNSPTILFGAGVVGMIGSTILACRATLKLDEVLTEIERNQYHAKYAKSEVESGNIDKTYSDKEFKRDLTIITVRGAGNVAKLYAPSVLVGAASVACLTKSHMILKDRNVALAAAYHAVDEAFKQYRSRVVDRYGEQIDRELRYDGQEVQIVDADGNTVSVIRANEDGESMYARWYDDISASNWKTDPDLNLMFLRQQQCWANDMLRHRGHMFLNEVYEMLGMEHSSAGSQVGWIYDKDHPNGDNIIDFGIYDPDGIPFDFFNGREGAILLDFNVDGVIWDKIDDSVRRNSWKN